MVDGEGLQDAFQTGADGIVPSGGFDPGILQWPYPFFTELGEQGEIFVAGQLRFDSISEGAYPSHVFEPFAGEVLVRTMCGDEGLAVANSEQTALYEHALPFDGLVVGTAEGGRGRGGRGRGRGEEGKRRERRLGAEGGGRGGKGG